ncbi:hypothetical protein [Methanomassiliicoccus luminyensis]|nr:hypothetical protein [Methanomassiliicoccus luminyensis]
MKYYDFLAVPQPLVFGQVITDPMANNGEPFIYRKGGSDGMDAYLLKETSPYTHVIEIVEKVFPKYIYAIDKSFSYGRASYQESFRDYYRRVREAERFVASINWHVERMGEVWFAHMPYDYDVPVGSEGPVIKVMNVYDARTIDDDVYELQWEPGVLYKFVNMERKKREPAVI